MPALGEVEMTISDNEPSSIVLFPIEETRETVATIQINPKAIDIPIKEGNSIADHPDMGITDNMMIRGVFKAMSEIEGYETIV